MQSSNLPPELRDALRTSPLTFLDAVQRPEAQPWSLQETVKVLDQAFAGDSMAPEAPTAGSGKTPPQTPERRESNASLWRKASRFSLRSKSSIQPIQPVKKIMIDRNPCLTWSSLGGAEDIQRPARSAKPKSNIKKSRSVFDVVMMMRKKEEPKQLPAPCSQHRFRTVFEQGAPIFATEWGMALLDPKRQCPFWDLSSVGDLNLDVAAAVEALGEALRDPELAVQQEAAVALVSYGEAAAPVAATLGAALFNGPPALRVAAARALANVGPAAVAAIESAPSTATWSQLTGVTPEDRAPI